MKAGRRQGTVAAGVVPGLTGPGSSWLTRGCRRGRHGPFRFLSVERSVYDRMQGLYARGGKRWHEVAIDIQGWCPVDAERVRAFLIFIDPAFDRVAVDIRFEAIDIQF